MNPFTLAGVILALAAIAIYLGIAMARGNKPELTDAIAIVVSALAVPGAIRVSLTAVRPEFWTLMKALPQTDALSLSPEDAAFIIIGSMALLWVSVSACIQPFKRVW